MFTIDDIIQTEYKCSDINICTQSLLTVEDGNAPIKCNRKFGFFPILTADKFIQPHWICLNTRPYIFNDKQK